MLPPHKLLPAPLRTEISLILVNGLLVDDLIVGLPKSLVAIFALILSLAGVDRLVAPEEGQTAELAVAAVAGERLLVGVHSLVVFESLSAPKGRRTEPAQKLFLPADSVDFLQMAF